MSLALAIGCFTTVQAGMDDILDICKANSTEASRIMRERQNGARMSDMVERAHEQHDASRAKAIAKIIIRAFEAPQHPTTKGKENTVTAFENQVYLECLKFWMP